MTIHPIYTRNHGVHLLRSCCRLKSNKFLHPPNQIFDVGLSWGVVVFWPLHSYWWLVVVCCHQPSLAPSTVLGHLLSNAWPSLSPAIVPSMVGCCLLFHHDLSAPAVLRLPALVFHPLCNHGQGHLRAKPNAAASHFVEMGPVLIWRHLVRHASPCVGGGLSASNVLVSVPWWKIWERGLWVVVWVLMPVSRHWKTCHIYREDLN